MTLNHVLDYYLTSLVPSLFHERVDGFLLSSELISLTTSIYAIDITGITNMSTDFVAKISETASVA